MRISPLLIFCLLLGCQASPPVLPTPSATPAAPSSAPSSATPSPLAPVATVPPGTTAEGKRLGQTSLLSAQALARDPLTGDWLVVERLADFASPPRFGLSRYGVNGEFKQQRSIAEPEQLAPTTVSGLTVDIRGWPVFTVSEARSEQGKSFLRTLSPSGVEAVRDFPVEKLGLTGQATLASDGAQIGLAYEQMASGSPTRVVIVAAEPGETSHRIQSAINPFAKLTAMAFDSRLNLILVGVEATGESSMWRWGTGESQPRRLGSALGFVPTGLVCFPSHEIAVVEQTAGKPARLHRYSAAGEGLSTTELRLAGGGYLTNVMALAPNDNGLLVAGEGFDGTGARVAAFYSFP